MESQFLEEMSRAGIAPTHALVFDGRLRRYHVQGQRKGRKNGWYRFVKLRSDFAYGAFGCNKTGISEKWSSKGRKEITKYDHSLMRKRAAEIQAEIEAAQAKAAIKANALWGRSRSAGEHDYTVGKGIGLYGLRTLHNMLVVPVYIDNYIVSLQFIARDGHKRFLTDGKMEGGYFWVGGDSDTVYLTEGYATAASIHEATGQQVVMSFFAGNLMPVAESLRAKLPDKKIVIAADNDQWTKGNPGLSAAQAASDKIGATVMFPRFNYEDQSRPTDWNDYHRQYGLKALAEELIGIKKEAAPLPVIPEDKQWRDRLTDGKEERPGYKPFDPKSKNNAYLFMENHEWFKGALAYNIFTDNVYFIKCPPWEHPAKFAPRELNDTDEAMFVMHLENLGIKTGKDVVSDFIIKLASENTINPPYDYFERLVWDRTPRLDKWLTYYLGADKQPAEYLALIGAKWMMGAVSRVYDPGCKFDNILILEGKQDIKKSTAFETLATFHNEVYFLEFSGDVTDKDSLMEMNGNLIVELSELASMGRVAHEMMKTFITRKVDKYRPPYGRRQIKRRRFFVLGATTNNDKADAYLLDPTGGRRYWPAECSAIDIEALIRDREQLWAEAVARYKGGERTWLDEEDKEYVLLEQAARRYEDSWMEPIDSYLIGHMEISVHQLCKQCMNLTSEQINSKNEKRVIRCLKELGWERIPTRPRDEKGARITLWRKKNEG